MNKIDSRFMAKVGILSAAALILYYIEFPIFPAFPWLMVDFSEVPVLLGGFALGPIAGIIIEFIKNILHFILKGATGGVGELANFLLGVAFVVPAVLCYNSKKCIKRAVFGIILGVVVACIMAIILNYCLFIPLYFPTMEDVFGYILAGALPVTAIKYLANGIIVYFLYPKLRRFFK